MSRPDAFDIIETRGFRKMMRGVVFDERHAHQQRDEAPQAYKDLGEVMRAQKDLVATKLSLVPVLNYKGC